MRKNGKYRFTLQFPAETEEQIRAGELLERLGNRKSAVIIAALDEYLLAHPALQETKCKVEVNATYNVQPADIERMVRELVEEQLSHPKIPDKTMPVKENTDINEMLDNLDVLQ